jgi:hypothetical protein
MRYLAVLLTTLAMAQSDVPANIVFYRDTRYAGNSLHASIKIDGDKTTHRLPNNRFWTTELPAGEHHIYGDEDQFGRTYRLDGGKTYYFRVETSFTGHTLTGRLRFRVVPVAAEIADGEMTGLKPDKR